jgi:predicted metalloprotease
MELNENAQVDTSQIEDRRGAGGGGGFGGGGIPIPIPGGGGGRGGLLMTIIAIVVALLGGGGVLASQMGGGGNAPADNSGLDKSCATSNPDHTKQTDCRNALFVNSIQNFWSKELPQVSGKPYEQAPTVFFSQQVNTGCGAADSGVGPFYCPQDHKVYIDLAFYDELATRFGAKGEFAQPYVLAHEYGHHVQSLLGTEASMRRAQQRDPGNANKYSVMLELQADCYSGVWTKHATETTDANGQPIFKSITQADIQQALEAAASVGDDTIQKKMGNGQVDESKFTHGTSAQRQQWFNTGYQSGEPKSCDTFGNSL